MKSLAIIFFTLFISNVFANDFPSRSEAVIFADIIDQHLMTRKNELKGKNISVLEFLLYKHRVMAKSLETEDIFTKKFSSTRILAVRKADKTIQYSFGRNQRKLLVIAQFKEDKVVWTIEKRNKDEKDAGSLITTNLDKEYIDLVERMIYDQVQAGRGYGGLQMGESIALNAQGEIKLEDNKGKGKLLRIKEKFIRDNKFDNTEWKYVPIKLVAYPAQKIMYEIPALISNTVIESVTRSPIHNIQGAGSEFKGAGKSLLNGFIDLVRGIANPRKGTSIDGVLTIVDGGFKIVKGAAGIVKSAVSIVGYPIYRLFGGKKSQRVALRGKRAAIVLIDTGTYVKFTDITIDTYGEMIVRNQLKSVSDYYCVSSSAEDNSLRDCIDEMPDKIEYVDFFALTHSGGDYDMERLAKYAVEVKGVKPELMVSIGCYDDPSTYTEKENTVGQKELSWAVHFYLSNLISKRLRGIPMDKAANEAFYGSMPINAVNPVSLGGVGVVGAMSGDLKEGYFGSKPDLYTDDSIATEMIKAAWTEVRKAIADIEVLENDDDIIRKSIALRHYEGVRQAVRNGAQELPESTKQQVLERLDNAFMQLAKAHDTLQENRDVLNKNSIQIFDNSKELLAKVNTLTNSELVAQYMKIQNIEVALNEDVKKEIGIY